MRLNDSTDVALRIMIYAASVADRMFTIDDIVAAYGVPRSTVMKVVNALAQPAAEVNLAAIVRHMEPDFGLPR